MGNAAKLWIAALGIILLTSTAHAGNNTLFSDNFETQNLYKWNQTQSSGWGIISDNNSYVGNTSVSARNYLIIDEANINQFNLTGQFKIPTTGSQGPEIAIRANGYSSGTLPKRGIVFYFASWNLQCIFTNESVVNQNCPGAPVANPIAFDTNYHPFRVVADGGNYTFWLNGTKLLDTNVTGLGFTNSTVGISYWSGTYARIDNIFLYSFNDNLTISNWTNDYTNDQDTEFTIPAATAINFNLTNFTGIDTPDNYSWLYNGVSRVNNFSNLTLNLSGSGVHNITATAFNLTNGTSDHITWLVTSFFNLTAPANNSSINASFPPLTTDVNFTWTATNSYNYNLIVSKDVNFNQNVVDTYTQKRYSVRPLEAGHYFWKVRAFNVTSGVYQYQSGIFNFWVNNTYNQSGQTGIHGVVYEIKGNVSAAVDGAKVSIWNATWSDVGIVGSNGYYLFDNLANNTFYYVKATKKGYDDSNTEIVNTTRNWTVRNVLMQVTSSPYIPFEHYVTFRIRSYLGTRWSGVSVHVFKGDDVIATKEGVTDTEGKAVFLLQKEQKYRITFVSAAQDINEELTVYPADTEYIIYVSGSPIVNMEDNISWSLYSVDNNATTKYLNLTWLSNTTTTTGHFWVHNSTGALLYAENKSDFTSWTTGYAVNSSNGNTYTWGFNATHPTWGFIDPVEVMVFRSTYVIDLKFSDTRMYTWLSIGFLMLLASLFSFTTNKFGYVLLPLFAMFTWVIGWFPQGRQDVHFVVILTTLILGSLMYIRTSEKKELYPY